MPLKVVVNTKADTSKGFIGTLPLDYHLGTDNTPEDLTEALTRLAAAISNRYGWDVVEFLTITFTGTTYTERKPE